MRGLWAKAPARSRLATGSASTPRSAGFTFIELAVVVAIVGVLLAVIAPSILASRTSSQALAIVRLADAAAANYVVLTSVLGVTTETVSSPVPAVGLTIEDVLFQGVEAVSPPFVDAYRRTGVRALAEHVAF